MGAAAWPLQTAARVAPQGWGVPVRLGRTLCPAHLCGWAVPAPRGTGRPGPWGALSSERRPVCRRLPLPAPTDAPLSSPTNQSAFGRNGRGRSPGRVGRRVVSGLLGDFGRAGSSLSAAPNSARPTRGLPGPPPVPGLHSPFIAAPPPPSPKGEPSLGPSDALPGAGASPPPSADLRQELMDLRSTLRWVWAWRWGGGGSRVPVPAAAVCMHGSAPGSTLGTGGGRAAGADGRGQGAARPLLSPTPSEPSLPPGPGLLLGRAGAPPAQRV